MSRVSPTGRAVCCAPPASFGRIVSTIAGLALAVLVAGCGERAPLYAPLAAGINHGYTDHAIAPDKYTVTYDAPPYHSQAVSKKERDNEVQRRVQLAYDMALWRAAELASRNGYVAFVTSDRTNTIALDRHDFSDLPEHPQCYTPTAIGVTNCAPFTPPDYLEGFVIIHAHVTFTATFEESATPGSLNADDTVTKLKSQYPDSEMIDQDIE
jgi:predicted small lipoprotein YifL